MMGARRADQWLMAAFAAAAVMCAPAFASPTVEQIGQMGPAELVLHTGTSKALVRQQVRLQLRDGQNSVSFSWTAGKIDASSVRLEAKGLQVGETTRPAGTEKTLQWSVTAPEAGEHTATLSYLLDGIKWSPDYRMHLAAGETRVTLSGTIALTNESGLHLKRVDAKLVLGRPGGGTDAGERLVFPIFSLESLPVGETFRTRFLDALEMPVERVYRIDSEHAAERVDRLLVVQPPSTGVLGREALPTGSMHLTIDRGEQPARVIRTKLDYEPSEEFEIGIGPERDVLVERDLLEHRKVEMEFDRLGKVSGFDTVQRYRLRVTSYLARAIELEIIETVLETWELRTDALHVLEDGRAIMRLPLPAGDQASLEFTLIKHSGTRIP